MAFSSFTDSPPVFSDVVRFTGLYLHFPEEPQGTSTQFPYGKDLRAYSSDVGGKELVLAGRRFQIMEFGEHQTDTFSVVVHVPHGPSYETDRISVRNFGNSKRVVVARDNRGVVVHGTISALGEDHESWGSSFSFDVRRVNREEIRVD